MGIDGLFYYVVWLVLVVGFSFGVCEVLVVYIGLFYWGFCVVFEVAEA
jgi:hypothetical protein